MSCAVCFVIILYISAKIFAEIWADLLVQTDPLGERWCTKSHDAKWGSAKKSHVSLATCCLMNSEEVGQFENGHACHWLQYLHIGENAFFFPQHHMMFSQMLWFSGTSIKSEKINNQYRQLWTDLYKVKTTISLNTRNILIRKKSCFSKKINMCYGWVFLRIISFPRCFWWVYVPVSFCGEMIRKISIF